MIRLLQQNWPFFLPYLLFLLTGGVLQLLYSPTEIFLFINARYDQLSDSLFPYLTHIGDGLFYACIIVLIAFFSYRYAFIALVSFGLSALLAQVLKRLAFSDALRPKAFFEGSDYTLHFVDGVAIHSFNSFPSGHATTAFAVFCLLSLVFRQKQWGFVWFVLALLAAYSRIYLSQHFFWDVYAGSLIGVFVTVGVYYYMDAKFQQGKMPWGAGSLSAQIRRRGVSGNQATE